MTIRYKHLEVKEDIHDMVFYYCAVNRIKMRPFVDSIFLNHEGIKSLNEKRKEEKFK